MGRHVVVFSDVMFEVLEDKFYSETFAFTTEPANLISVQLNAEESAQQLDLDSVHFPDDGEHPTNGVQVCRVV